MSDRVRGYLPILSWAPASRSTLTRDVLAGLTLWGLVVPEGMAYAGIAGLPAQAGLYTIMVALVAYAIFGTSRQLVVVATSATAALTASTVAEIGVADAAEYAAYAAALVMLVGLLFLIAGFLKLGFIAQFLSRPVIEGFIIGLALFVAVGQLHKIFGVDKGEGNTPQALWGVLTELGDTNPWTLGVGLVSFAALTLLPRMAPRLPSGLLVLALAIAASWALDLSGSHGVDVVGTLPQGLPSVGLPSVELSALWTLIPAAAGILLLGYSEALAIGQSFARQHNYEIDPNQELIAFGAANLSSGAVGGLVACGGMSGSAVNDGAGAKSQFSGITAAVLGVVTVLWLKPLFAPLPEATLGALIIHAVAHLMDPDKLRAVYRLKKQEFYLGLIALIGVLLIDVLAGLILAMVISLLLVLYQSSRPSVKALGRVADGHLGFAALVRHPDAVPVPGVLVVRLDAPLYFANATANSEEIKRLVTTSDPPVRAVVFDPEVQHDLDVTSIEMLRDLLEWLAAQEVAVYAVSTHADLMESAQRAGLVTLFGEEHVSATIDEALAKVTR